MDRRPPGLYARVQALMKRHSGRVVLVSGAVFIALVVLSAIAPLLTRLDPNYIDPMNRLRRPGSEHLLGTDTLGRDVFARVLYGGRVSLAVGFAVASITISAGYALGLTAAMTRLDNVLMRMADGLMAFPAVLLALGLIAVFGASPVNVVAAVSLVYAPRVARLARGIVIIVQRQGYVEAAISIGAGMERLVRKHILPNTLSPLIVQATFIFAYAVQIEAALSFLGVGIPPDIPSWGNVLQENRLVLTQAPWISLAAGLAIVITVLTLNVLGDALRDYLDPRMRGFLS